MKRLILLVLLSLFVIVGAVGAQDAVTVTWWMEPSGSDDHVQELIIDAFNAAHDNIQIDYQPQESINDQLRPALQAGVGPDIVWLAGNAAASQYVAGGFLLPLTGYADAYGWADKLLPWAYGAGIVAGELYSIPVTYESMVLFYNKTVFEENGWEVPTTADELWGLAHQSADMGLVPFPYGNATWQPSNEHLMGIYLNNYAGPDNVYAALIGEKAWTDSEFAEATELLREQIADLGWFGGSLEDYYSLGGWDPAAMLASGEGTMMMSGTWMFRGLSPTFAETGMEWDWAPLPPFSEDADMQVGPYSYDLALGGNLGVNAATEHPEEVGIVLDFLLSDKARILELASTTGFGEWVIPLRYEIEDFPPGTDERVLRFHSDFAATTGAGRYGYTAWTFWPARANQQLWEAIELVWAGEMSVEEYLENHAAEWAQDAADGLVLSILPRE